jgi:hypothetical protein
MFLRTWFCCAGLTTLAFGCSASSQNGSNPSTACADCDAGSAPSPSPAVTSIEIPATNGELSLPYSVTMQGAGSNYVGAVSISGDVGTIVFDHVTLPVVAYTQDWFAAANRNAYTILAAQSAFWVVFFAYCDTSGNLTDVWYETTNGAPDTDETATGTCVTSATTVSAKVQFPAVNMPFPSLASGFTIDGANIHYDGTTPGTFVDATTTRKFFPFTTVFCTTCGVPDTYELHSILWDPNAQQACYGIFYIGTIPGQVGLNLALCLPSLTKLPVGVYPATATTP